jgi:hypothetical protein
VASIKELTFDCSAARRQLAWEPMTGVSCEHSTTLERTGCATLAAAD